MKAITRNEASAQGLRRYFTGSPCPRGHWAERYVSSKSCVECQRVSSLSTVGVAKRLSRTITTDFNRLTDAQIDAWHAAVRDIRPNRQRYKHRPLDELAVIWRPPLRFKAPA